MISKCRLVYMIPAIRHINLLRSEEDTMESIKELSPTRVSQLKKLCRKSNKNADALRNMMLDLLASAYEEETYIPNFYYTRANDILSLAMALIYHTK